MAVVVLVFHLIICIGLVALVLLQRSEGGALGMGGGGGGALMSGRGAADALAKMTQIAGGVFLVTSLALTMIQGAAQTSSSRSVFDSLPQAPAFHLPNFGGSDEKAAPPQTPTNDPLESSVPASTQTASAPLTIAPSAASASERAGPVVAAPAAPVAATAPRPAAATNAAAQRPAATATATPAAARPASTAPRPATPRPATRPANGVASGVTVPVETTDDPLAVRRDTRAGPDQ